MRSRVLARCESCARRALCEVVRLAYRTADGPSALLCCAMCAGDYEAKGLAS